MGVTTKEKGVLKLVHPGRHVEYHRKAITAEEIMSKNPRHSITRTDFFKNSDILVRPESVMVPGQVFYIVPNKTIHKLLKDRSQLFDRPSIQQDESPNIDDYKQGSKQTSPCKEMTGRTPMYHFHQEHEGSSACDNFLPEPEETTQEVLVDDVLDDSLTLTFQARDYYLNRTSSARKLTSNYGQLQKRSYKQVNNLKSCMKKYGSISASSNRRVTFNFCTMFQCRK